jgi:ABC-type phosphate/phosphonate transport system substrate-binding protein
LAGQISRVYLATLAVLNQFDNPARQLLVIEVKSFNDAYTGMASGKCAAAIMRDNAFAKLEKEKGVATVVYKSEGIGSQGFSVSPRLSSADKAKIAQALLAAEAQKRVRVFFERYS